MDLVEMPMRANMSDTMSDTAYEKALREAEA